MVQRIWTEAKKKTQDGVGVRVKEEEDEIYGRVEEVVSVLSPV